MQVEYVVGLFETVIVRGVVLIVKFDPPQVDLSSIVPEIFLPVQFGIGVYGDSNPSRAVVRKALGVPVVKLGQASANSTESPYLPAGIFIDLRFEGANPALNGAYRIFFLLLSKLLYPVRF